MQKYAALLQEARSLNKIQPEKNVFSLGGCGHYENPITDLLAFFCDPSEQHNFNTLFIDSLFQATHQSVDLTRPINTPIREQITKQGKRIDLIIEGEDWVMVIENKIRHWAANPFSEYESYIKENYKDKKPILILLAINQEVSPKNWLSLSYQSLIEKLKINLGTYTLSSPYNKWQVILREFILNIESEYSVANQDIINFARANYFEIKAMSKMLEDYLSHLKIQLAGAVKLASESNCSVTVSKNEWEEGSALRIASELWRQQANITLLIMGNEEYRVQFYLYQIPDEQVETVKSFFKPHEHHYRHFGTENKTTRCIGFFDTTSETLVFEEIKRLTQQLNAYFN
ncbi:MAG: hypothetical protein E6Q83_01675 [Thiothrix sp.]|nr:MAG: hypothetical protein E6Q83_01675 [Thiothrix sp.]